MKIIITKKRLGTWVNLKESKPINEINPQSIIGIAEVNGDVITAGGKSFEAEFDFSEDNKNVKFVKNSVDTKDGYTYVMNKSINKNEYIRLKVIHKKLNKKDLATVNKVIGLYLLQYDTESKISNYEKNQKLIGEIRKKTGYLVTNPSDFEKFLGLYSILIKHADRETQQIKDDVENNIEHPIGRPYLSLKYGTLIFGIKGVPLSGKKSAAFHLFPGGIYDTKENDPDFGLNKFKNYLKYVTGVTERIIHSTSKDGLLFNRKTFTINENDEITIGKKYDEYLKDNIEITINSYNIGSVEKPNYITIIQPVIEFKEYNSDYKLVLLDKEIFEGDFSENTVEEVAKKIEEEKPLNSQEQAVKNIIPERIQKKVDENKVTITKNEEEEEDFIGFLNI